MKADIQQWEFVHPRLRRLCVWLEDQTGFEFTITRLYRIGDSGVHGQLPVRGCDLRMRDMKTAATIQELVNSFWQYDSFRPKMQCAIAHGKGSEFHLHLQVHENTGLMYVE